MTLKPRGRESWRSFQENGNETVLRMERRGLFAWLIRATR
jgi:hypothetical protein